MRGTGLTLILIILLTSSTIAGAEWWNQSFDRRQEIRINNTGVNLTHYSFLINVSYDSDMQPDFDDIRFLNNCTSSATLLPYWFQEINSSINTRVWVNVSTISNVSNTTLCMYYGNAAVGNLSNGTATFMFFDDFSGAAVDWTNKWQSTEQGSYTTENGALKATFVSATTKLIQTLSTFNNYIVEARTKHIFSAGANFYMDLTTAPATFLGQEYAVIQSGGSAALIGGLSSAGAASVSDTWYRSKIVLPSTGTAGAYIYSDNLATTIASKTGTPSATTSMVSFLPWTSGTGYVDWVIVRKYASTEPTYSFGAEEMGVTFFDITPANNSMSQELNVNISTRIVFQYTQANITFWNNNDSNSTILTSLSDVVSNITSSYNWSTLDYGRTYCWFVQVVNLTESTNSSIFCFTTRGGIVVYNEDAPTVPITVDVTVVFSNATDIWQRNVASGTLNVTGVPTTEKIQLAFQGNVSYHARTVLLPNGLQEIDRLFLLPKTADAIANSFIIIDYTGGDFSTSGTMILFKRWLSGTDRYVFGGHRGVSNSLSAICHFGATYNVYVANAFETRFVGLHDCTIGGAVTLDVGSVTYPAEIEVPGEWVITALEKGVERYANDTIYDAWVRVTYNDTKSLTQWINFTILKNDATTILETNATFGAALVTFTHHFNLSEVDVNKDKFVASLNFSTNGTLLFRNHYFDFFTVQPSLGMTRVFHEEWQLPEEYTYLVGLFVLCFTALIFSYQYSDIGGIITVAVGGILWTFGFLPLGVNGLGIIILVSIIAFLNAIFVKRRRIEL